MDKVEQDETKDKIKKILARYKFAIEMREKLKEVENGKTDDAGMEG